MTRSTGGSPSRLGDGLSVLSRRRWLRYTLGAGAVVLGSGGGLALQLFGWPSAVPGLRVLSARSHRTLARLAEAVFPPGGAFARSAHDLDLALAFDRFLADEPAWVQRDVGGALVLLELGPVLYDRGWRPFSDLSLDERLAHFERWMTSDDPLRRQVATALRRFLQLVFYDQPEVWPALGYDGPLIRVEESP